jgi:CHAD domain-containing protein
MTASTSFADKPMAMGLTALLKEKTRAIDTECERFVSVGDAEALHDLRVALRRLHTLFSGFASCFREESSLPQRLRTLLKETNAARDLEVSLSLIEQQRLALPRLQQKWQAELKEEYHRLRENLPPVWRNLSAELDAPQQILVVNLPEMSLGAYAAALIATKEKRLRRKGKLLLGKWGKKRAHRLRIAGKRLRYLLEPFTEDSAPAASAVARLKRFQDLLGDYHDIVVLRQRLLSLPRENTAMSEMPLEHAAQQLKRSRRHLRNDFLHQYRSKMAGQLYAAVKRARRDLAHQQVSSILERP